MRYIHNSMRGYDTKKPQKYLTMSQSIFTSGASSISVHFLCYAMALPEKTQITSSKCAKLMKFSERNARRVLKELVDLGYAQKIECRENGKITEIHYHLYDNPIKKEDLRLAKFVHEPVAKYGQWLESEKANKNNIDTNISPLAKYGQWLKEDRVDQIDENIDKNNLIYNNEVINNNIYKISNKKIKAEEKRASAQSAAAFFDSDFLNDSEQKIGNALTDAQLKSILRHIPASISHDKSKELCLHVEAHLLDSESFKFAGNNFVYKLRSIISAVKNGKFTKHPKIYNKSIELNNERQFRIDKLTIEKIKLSTLLAALEKNTAKNTLHVNKKTCLCVTCKDKAIESLKKQLEDIQHQLENIAMK